MVNKTVYGLVVALALVAGVSQAKGINEKVAPDFWNSTKDIMLNHFKNGNNKQALVDGILKAGEQLKQHFPYQDDDVDELSNEISKG